MKTILVTGCSGYVGSLLVQKLMKRDDVELVIGLDKNPLPSALHVDEPRFHFVQKNTSGDWEDEVARFKPNFVVHCAWQIRELYGEEEKQRLWNINGSHQVFDYVFNQGDIKKMVHISTVASYGAYASNTRDMIFTEDMPLRASDYLYAEEKRKTEEMLFDLYDKYANHKSHLPEVFILRPASITGTVGRTRSGFSLQSVLQGRAKDSIFAKVLSSIMSFTPVSPLWTRQFVHEDDVVGSIENLLFNTDEAAEIDICNLCPEGDIIDGKRMAELLGKRAVTLPPILYKWMFFLAWHLSLGKIPTSHGSYKTYCYPIVVDGSKLTNKYGYQYLYTTEEALTN